MFSSLLFPPAFSKDLVFIFAYKTNKKIILRLFTQKKHFSAVLFETKGRYTHSHAVEEFRRSKTWVAFQKKRKTGKKAKNGKKKRSKMGKKKGKKG